MAVLLGHGIEKRPFTAGMKFGPCLYHALVFNLLVAGSFLLSARAFAGETFFDEIIAMSRNGDFVLTCDYPSPGSTCSVFQRSDPKVKMIIHHFGEEISIEDDSLFYKAYKQQKKEIIKRAEKVLSEEYPEKKIKLGWHGKNAMTSPDDRFEIKASGDFFLFLYVIDKQTQVRYPVFATAGAYACDWPEVAKHLYTHDDDYSPFCIKKALWQKNKLTLIIAGEHHYGYQDFIYDIGLSDLKEENLEQIRKEFLLIATILSKDSEAKKLSDKKGMVLWSVPWGRKLHWLSGFGAFEKTLVMGNFRERMFRPLGYFLLADQMGASEPVDYFRMIRKTLKVLTSLELSPGFWGKKFSAAAKEHLNGRVNDFLLALRSQLPGEKARKTTEKILKDKTMKQELKNYDEYKTLVEAYKQLDGTVGMKNEK